MLAFPLPNNQFVGCEKRISLFLHPGNVFPFTLECKPDATVIRPCHMTMPPSIFKV